MTELYCEIKKCRSCGSDRIEPVLDLGTHCISDFVDDGQECDKAPLMLVRCHDCTLVQLAHTVDRDRLYRRYWYHSGQNESMVKALKDVVDDVTSRVQLTTEDLVADIGCNDGTLLDFYPSNIHQVGFEPSALANEAARPDRQRCIEKTYYPPRDRAFPRLLAPILDRRPWVWDAKPKIITSCAVFYDLDDPNAFVAGIKDWLHPDGIWVVQMMGLEQMLAQTAFDNICHEHLEYWSKTAFLALCAKHGLSVAHVSHNDVNGGSVRYIVKHARVGDGVIIPKYQDVPDLKDFARRVQGLRISTLVSLDGWRKKGELVLGYGASTKGNTLLQYYGIGPDLIPAIADRNPAKVGKFTVGSGIPIISEKEMRDHVPDYLFVFPWGFIDAFKERERPFLWRGGQFILPLPTLRTSGLEAETCQPSPVANFART